MLVPSDRSQAGSGARSEEGLGSPSRAEMAPPGLGRKAGRACAPQEREQRKQSRETWTWDSRRA